MNVRIEESWKKALIQEFDKDYFHKLTDFVREEYNTQTIFPAAKNIFNAFEHTSFENVKVVILGQDPYHGPGQAHGLSFSVPDGVALPPSLINIYKEIEAETGKKMPATGDLTRWADQGVLLLNATLTVRAHNANSHEGRGWEIFTDAVIKTLSDQGKNIVFMLWGSYARKKKVLIDSHKHLILESAHPSPLSAYRGFFGNNHFKQCNEYLKAHGKMPVDW